MVTQSYKLNDRMGDFGVDSPASHGFAVTPHDTNPLQNGNEDVFTRAIYVGGTGDVKLTTRGGDTVTFSAVPAGTIIPIMAKIIFNTGTTATLIVGMY